MNNLDTENQVQQIKALNQLLTDFLKAQNCLIKRLRGLMALLCICFSVIICVMIGGFFWYESQYETTEVTTTTMETDGDNADINSVTNGDMYNDSSVHNE